MFLQTLNLAGVPLNRVINYLAVNVIRWIMQERILYSRIDQLFHRRVVSAAVQYKNNNYSRSWTFPLRLT